MHVVAPYLNADNKCIVMQVVKPLRLFFRESNDEAFCSRYLWHGARQLDALDHPEVSLVGLL